MSYVTLRVDWLNDRLWRWETIHYMLYGVGHVTCRATRSLRTEVLVRIDSQCRKWTAGVT